MGGSINLLSLKDLLVMSSFFPPTVVLLPSAIHLMPNFYVSFSHQCITHVSFLTQQIIIHLLIIAITKNKYFTKFIISMLVIQNLSLMEFFFFLSKNEFPAGILILMLNLKHTTITLHYWKILSTFYAE